MSEPQAPRIGLVIPSTNTTVERELPPIAADAVGWFATRVLQVETDDPAEKIGTVLAMRDELDAASDRLAGLGPSAVGFACTAASFLDGLPSDLELCERLSARLGVPFVTASRAVARALAALGARRVALVTPYIAEVDEKEAAYFRRAGVETVAASGLGIVGNLPKGRLPLSASADAVRALVDGGVRERIDAVFVSCTNWLTLGNIPALEAELGVPVVSSNSALAWALLREAGAGGVRRPELGALGSTE
ncbi:MAG: aspartate/glutamate racemase family protein, partial [Protaetiibacter sp.]